MSSSRVTSPSAQVSPTSLKPSSPSPSTSARDYRPPQGDHLRHSRPHRHWLRLHHRGGCHHRQQVLPLPLSQLAFSLPPHRRKEVMRIADDNLFEIGCRMCLFLLSPISPSSTQPPPKSSLTAAVVPPFPTYLLDLAEPFPPPLKVWAASGAVLLNLRLESRGRIMAGELALRTFHHPCHDSVLQSSSVPRPLAVLRSSGRSNVAVVSSALHDYCSISMQSCASPETIYVSSQCIEMPLASLSNPPSQINLLISHSLHPQASSPPPSGPATQSAPAPASTTPSASPRTASLAPACSSSQPKMRCSTSTR